jgi:hypothetical protein
MALSFSLTFFMFSASRSYSSKTSCSRGVSSGRDSRFDPGCSMASIWLCVRLEVGWEKSKLQTQRVVMVGVCG